jgi:hypothetical protein
MKLPQPFYRLPVRVDVGRLQSEVAQFADKDWQRHPTGFAGNSAIRLISARGEENDDFEGAMAPSAQLQRCAYIGQLLQHFGVVWSRSRLMRLAPGAVVPEHSDIDYHWFHRVRIHVPVFTQPQVSFTCDGQTVHMASGEVWVFDNYRLHHVHNGGDRDRVHLVADTTGSANFWRLVHSGWNGIGSTPSLSSVPEIAYQSGVEAALQLEQHNLGVVMPPSEVEQLSRDLLDDLVGTDTKRNDQVLDRFTDLVRGFSQDWRRLWALFADTAEGWDHFRQLRDAAVTELERLNGIAKITCAGTRTSAADVFYRRVLFYAFRERHQTESRAPRQARPVAVQPPSGRISKPVFIVGAPRSGSTVLFETLAQASNVHTLGGEAHFLTEGLEQLRPQAPGVDSNRLTAAHLSAEARDHIQSSLDRGLRDRDGRLAADGALRWLEKTPKNALRIPFFDAMFPDARFIYLWRDPRNNISSIMDAWRSGGWVTYRQLKAWDGPPWSMLLPPGWQSLRGASLEEIATYQWRTTNEIVLSDLAALERRRWTVVSYSDFMRNPMAEIERLCRFADLDLDTRMAAYLEAPLPLSKHTLTPPSVEKWRRNELALSRVLPQQQDLEAQLLRLTADEQAAG